MPGRYQYHVTSVKSAEWLLMLVRSKLHAKQIQIQNIFRWFLLRHERWFTQINSMQKKKKVLTEKSKLLMPQWNISLKVTNSANLKVVLFLPKKQNLFVSFFILLYIAIHFYFFLPQYKRLKNGLGVHCLLQYLCQFVRVVWWLWQNKYLTSYPCYCFASSTLFSYSAFAINVLNFWLCCVSSWADS